MKLVEMKCKNCGALLNVDENAKDITCNYCNAQYKIDDEIQHVRYDNMQNSGYEFERGRIQAINEEKERAERERREQKEEIARLQRKQSNVKWWVLGWIFCFPIPLSILIWRKRWYRKYRIMAIAGIWSMVIIVAILYALL